jgi:hypothetical protein
LREEIVPQFYRHSEPLLLPLSRTCIQKKCLQSNDDAFFKLEQKVPAAKELSFTTNISRLKIYKYGNCKIP